MSVCLQKISETGCDELVAVGVWNKILTSPSERWLYREAEHIDQMTLKINFFMHEMYEIKVTITNNENISSTSETSVVDLRTRKSYR